MRLMARKSARPGAPPKPAAGPLPRWKGPAPDEASVTPEQCLNCGALVLGKFCAECGQEHSERAVSLGHLVGEFLQDTFSLDSKLLKTAALLLFRPGFLTNEYNSGRRARYLSPWRMYVFTSVALFFLLSRAAPPISPAGGPPPDLRPISLRAEARAGRVTLTWKGAPGAASYKVKRAAAAKGPFRDVATGLTARRFVDAKAPAGAPSYYEVVALAPDGRRGASEVLAITPGVQPGGPPVVSEDLAGMVRGEIRLSDESVDLDSLPDTVEEYEAAQARLPRERRDTWWRQLMVRRSIEVRNSGLRSLEGELVSGMLENAPKAMMVMVPLFALLLKALYLRRRRLYIEHLVFALHAHAFVFTLLALEALSRDRFPSALVPPLAGVYLAFAMRAVYRQGWGKTLVKGGLLTVSYGLLLVCAVVGVIVLTLVTG